ncbi:MAG: rhomboid family intramembrane serine protease [Pseudomonadota bacterium]
MIILPISHDKLDLKQLPFVTIGIIAFCVVIYFPLAHLMKKDEQRQAGALEAAQQYYVMREYLELPDEILKQLPDPLRKRYDTVQEWVRWYRESPAEVEKYLRTRPMKKLVENPTADALRGFMDAYRGTPGSRTRTFLDLEKEMGIDEGQKLVILGRISFLGAAGMEEEQKELDRLFEEFKAAGESSLLLRFGFVPGRRSIIGAITHQFIHGGIFHLVFNMFFLWLAASKLEEIWSRPLFLGAYLFFGVAGAVTHAIAHPAGTAPLIGASGAVAGLMGAFMIRLARVKIRFFYAYWFFLKPRVGTFEAPAYFMLPIWFVSQLLFALLLKTGEVAYWAHIGGFVAGAALAVAFKLTRFEQRVLGREPEKEEGPEDMPLVPLQKPQQPAMQSGKAGTQKPIRFDVKGMKLERLTDQGITGTASNSRPVDLELSGVAFIAPARIIEIDSGQALRFFGRSAAPAGDSLILALILPLKVGPHMDMLSGYLIDGAEVRYEALTRSPSPSGQKNFIALTRLVVDLASNARYVSWSRTTGEHSLPTYADLDQFLGHLKQVAAGITAAGPGAAPS